jgi:hypothetical protein
MSEMTAFPLCWPDGWARHKGQRDSDARFKGPTFHWDRVYRGLIIEIGRIGGRDPIVSTNQPIRADGYPYAQQRAIHDPGVAVYFTRNKKSLVMAQDRFQTVIGNMRSLTMAIDGLRQMERHGGATMMERAFTGFLAIAPPSWKKPWREVLGFRENFSPPEAELRNTYRIMAKHRHPDNGGSDTLMAELNVAFAEAKAELGL